MSPSHRASFVCFLLCLWGTSSALQSRRCAATDRLIASRQHNRDLLSSGREERPSHGIELDSLVDAGLLVRGGASSDMVESESILASQIQSVFLKLLTSLEKRSPSLAGSVRQFLERIESLSGFKLLPPQKKKKKKKKQDSKKKKKRAKKETKSLESSSSSLPASSSSLAAKKKKKLETTQQENNKQTATSRKKKTKKKQDTASAYVTTAIKHKSSQATEHLRKEIKHTSPNYRIQRELKAFLADPPPNLQVKVGKNLRVWIVTMTGGPNTIYQGETFQLRIAFPAQYPTVPPSVYFLPPNIPVHEHVYTNGDICLSLLGKDWRPTMTAQSIAVSILSILSSAQSKSLPMDNARHALNKPGEYQKDWVYHDDNC